MVGSEPVVVQPFEFYRWVVQTDDMQVTRVHKPHDFVPVSGASRILTFRKLVFFIFFEDNDRTRSFVGLGHDGRAADSCTVQGICSKLQFYIHRLRSPRQRNPTENEHFRNRNPFAPEVFASAFPNPEFPSTMPPFFGPANNVSVRIESESDEDMRPPENALGLASDAFTPPAHCTSEVQIAAWYDAVIPTLPMEVRVQIARSAARRQDMAVLKSLSRLGAFSFSVVAQDMRLPSHSEVRFADLEIPIVAALACVIEGAAFAKVSVDRNPMKTNQSRPWQAELDRSIMPGRVPRELTVGDDFRLFFAHEVRRFLGSFDTWRAQQNTVTPNGGLIGRFRITLQPLLAAAIAMDDAPTTRVILEHPFFFDISELKPTILGLPADQRYHDVNSTVGRSFEMKLKPWVLGYEFESLHTAKLIDEILPGARTNAGNITTTEAAGGDPPTVGNLSVARLIAAGQLAVPGDVFYNLCINARLGWQEGKRTRNRIQWVHKAKLDFLTTAMLAGESSLLMSRYWDAGVSAGLHTLGTEQSRLVVLELIKESRASAIAEISADIDWTIPPKTQDAAQTDLIVSSHLFDMAVSTACDFTVDTTSRFVEPLMVLFTALRSVPGRAEAYVAEHVQALGDNRTMERLALSGYREMVHQFLECGFDLDKPGNSGQTLIQFLDPAKLAKDRTLTPALDSEYKAIHAMLLSQKVAQEARKAINSMSQAQAGVDSASSKARAGSRAARTHKPGGI